MENEVTRRIRDYDTGEISYVGSGFFAKIGSKLTGKTASKAAEKLIEKGAETKLVKKFISFLQSKKINQFKHMKQKEKTLSNF